MTYQQIAIPFFEKRLPAEVVDELKLSELKMEMEDYIDEKLHETQTDLLFSVPVKGEGGAAYIYILFEHKAQTSQDLKWQMLKRRVLIMEHHMRIHETHELPMVLPLVLHHGREPFTGSVDVANDIKAPEPLHEYRLSGPLILVDLTKKTDEELEGVVWLSLFEMVLKHIFDPEIMGMLPELIPRMIELRGQKRGLEYVVEVLRYMWSAGNASDTRMMVDAVVQSLPEVKPEMGTIAEAFIKKGEARGIKKGEARGRRKMLEEVTMRLLRNGHDLRTIEDSTGLSHREIITIRDQNNQH